MRSSDTIIAQATPPGFGSVGILRISGNRTAEIAQAILGKLPIPRYASYLPFNDLDGNVLDKGIAIWFPAPNSFTGEDVLEIQGHGGPIILDMLLKSILELRIARIAHPGEFSERAFLNKKIDLAQAEAIFDLIHASSEQAARSAIKSLQGVFSLKINSLLESLIYLRTQVEVSIDFPDENIDIISDKKIEAQLDKVIDNLHSVLDEATQGRLIREGMKIVIAGRPNSGKSSLLNALVGHKSAIVTDIPGTTCDVIREHIHIDGMPLHIIDTAGIRKASNDIERIGIEYAWQEIKDADHVLLVVDASITKEINVAVILPDFITHLPIELPITVVRNKVDITGESIGIKKIHNQSLICLSARTGEGIDILRTYLKHSMGFFNHVEGSFLARSRHLQALKLAKKHLKRGKAQILNSCSSELLAEELHLAQQALNEITGKFTTDDLLEHIFSCFCIGK